jgi:hypothetical protein
MRAYLLNVSQTADLAYSEAPPSGQNYFRFNFEGVKIANNVWITNAKPLSAIDWLLRDLLRSST